MKRKGIGLFLFQIYILLICVFLLGCKSEIINESSEVNLNKGDFVVENSNVFETFNFISEDKYEIVDTKGKIINNFNKISSTYTYYKEGSYFINYNNEDIKVNQDKVLNLKISPYGQDVFYFVNNEYLSPMVFDLKGNKEIILQNKVLISGQFIDWITEDKLVYYGVDNENKISGVFSYDITTNEEKLLYEIKNGYISFLKYINDEVIFIQEYFNGDAFIKIIKIDGSVVEVCNGIEEVSDIVSNGKEIFILGRMENNTYSIYEVIDNKVKRIVYDFPQSISIEKGLTINENNELLFIGSVNDVENIYKYSEESISLISNGEGKFNFIKVN